MYYVIFAQDIPNTLEKRLAVREQHLARLKQLQKENRASSQKLGCARSLCGSRRIR